jgi:hypothetical protein
MIPTGATLTETLARDRERLLGRGDEGGIALFQAELERRLERLCRLGRPARVEQRLAEMLQGEVPQARWPAERDAQARLGLCEPVEAPVRLAEPDPRGRDCPLVPDPFGEREALAELRDRFLVSSE